MLYDFFISSLHFVLMYGNSRMLSSILNILPFVTTPAAHGNFITIGAQSKGHQSSQTVHAFLIFFRALAVKPNAGHITLASLYLPSVSSRVIPSASSPPLHVTQNSDELSLHAVSVLPDPEIVTVAKEHLVQMHGSIFRTRCTSCKHVKHTYEPYLTNSLKDLDKDSSEELTISTDKLPRCGGDEWAGSNRYGQCGSLLRPDVVWFGEVPSALGEIARKLTWCDLLLVIGTSALVSRPFS
jgi:NAD-dependent deacetylase sirtuin 5